MAFSSKRAILLGLFCLLCGFAVSCRNPARKKEVRVVDGVEIVANPEVPLSRNHSRVLKLREHLRLKDSGDAFYFKYAEQPAIASDGSIFLRDEHQLLRFSQEGAFLGNLFKQGQGPGEFESLQRYVIEGNEIYAFDSNANKLVRMTLDGRWLDDRRLGDWYEALTRNWIVGSTVYLPKVEGVLADAKYNFYWISRAGPAQQKTHVFLTRFFRASRAFFAWDKFLWVPDADRDLLFISRTREYGVELLDLGEGRVTRSFRRAYSKVKYIMPDNMKAAFERSNAPKPEFESDILALYISGDLLWVRTSTEDPRKGVLIDVFNEKGDYLDNFYLRVKGSIMDVSGDVLFVKETDEAGEISIVLYKNLEFKPSPSAR